MEFSVEKNDIARMQVDAVVLPANWRLVVGTGASLALFEAAGREELEAECTMRSEQAKRNGVRLVPGVSVPTQAYALPAKIIIHAIVPKWDKRRSRKCYEDLCKSYVSALMVADEAGMETIAFPLLASGNNGFDLDLAIDVATESLSQYQPKGKLSHAYLVTFGGKATQKMRERGYDVAEVIGEEYVLGQDVHQADVVKNDESWGNRWKPRKAKTPLPQAVLDDAAKWILEPSNQKYVVQVALIVAEMVLPTRGAGAAARKVINVVSPLMQGKGRK